MTCLKFKFFITVDVKRNLEEIGALMERECDKKSSSLKWMEVEEGVRDNNVQTDHNEDIKQQHGDSSHTSNSGEDSPEESNDSHAKSHAAKVCCYD